MPVPPLRRMFSAYYGAPVSELLATAPEAVIGRLAMANTLGTFDAMTRNDAGAKNLQITSGRVEAIIEEARSRHEKAIVFVTGVPGAGKTLVGLNVTGPASPGTLTCGWLTSDGGTIPSGATCGRTSTSPTGSVIC